MADQKPFKILSIDGGGIRGVFPAMFLSRLEARLKENGNKKTQIYQHFDLICGTSTGGIIAIALALGIPAHEIHKLYLDNASNIFGRKRFFFGQLTYAAHERGVLEKLIKDKFRETFNGEDPRLKDCKTAVCIPIYDLLLGKPSVLKSQYHPKFSRDYHIPAYKAALATSAAPTFFNPYSSSYTDLNGIETPFQNKVDGGVMANNPTLLGIVEAQVAFYQPLTNLRVLSLGTGHQKFTDGRQREKWGLWYWMKQDNKARLIDLFMQGQSQQVQNLISLLQNGIDAEKRSQPNFIYQRIETELDDTLKVAMDETDNDKLIKLSEKASYEFQNNATSVIDNYCS
jgi:patatin-like phospholipase/acyl hydrolase